MYAVRTETPRMQKTPMDQTPTSVVDAAFVVFVAKHDLHPEHTDAPKDATPPYIYVSDIEGGSRGLYLAKRLKEEVFQNATLVMCGDSGDIDAFSIPTLEYLVNQCPKDTTHLLSGNRDYNVSRISEVLEGDLLMVPAGAGGANAAKYQMVHGAIQSRIKDVKYVASNPLYNIACKILLTSAWHRYTRGTMGAGRDKATWKDIALSYQGGVANCPTVRAIIEDFLNYCDTTEVPSDLETKVDYYAEAMYAVQEESLAMYADITKWRLLLEKYVRQSHIMHYCHVHKTLAVHDFFGKDGKRLSDRHVYVNLSNYKVSDDKSAMHVSSPQKSVRDWTNEVNKAHDAIVKSAFGGDIQARALMADLAGPTADSFLHGYRPSYYYEVLQDLNESVKTEEVDHIVCGHQPAPIGRLSRVAKNDAGYWLAEVDTQVTAFSRTAYLVHHHTFGVENVNQPKDKGKYEMQHFIDSKVMGCAHELAKSILKCYNGEAQKGTNNSEHSKWSLGVVSYMGKLHRVHCFLEHPFRGRDMLIVLNPCDGDKATTRGDTTSAVMLSLMIVEKVGVFEDVHVFKPLTHDQPNVQYACHDLSKVFTGLCDKLSEDALCPRVKHGGSVHIPASMCSKVAGTSFFTLVVGTSTLDPAVGNFTTTRPLKDQQV